MRICVLFNPRAGSADQMAALRDALAADRRVTVRELRPGDDLPGLAAAAARDGFDVVAVAGGDGTVHAAVNGLVAAGADAALAVIPLGTGNDLCRTLDIPLDPVAAVGLLRTAPPRRLDVLRVEGDFAGFVVNAATGGFSGKVAAEVTGELKAEWGPLAYLVGAAGPIADPPRYTLTIRYDDGPPEVVDDVLNVVVANGRTAAGGLEVAPDANPEDGLLDLIVVRSGDLLDRSVIAARLMAGDYQHDDLVAHRRARRVEIASDPPLPVSLDGERGEGSRFVFTVVPGAVRVLAGPGYAPAATPESPVEDEDDAPAPVPAVGRRLWGLVAGGLLLVKRAPAATAGLAAAAVLVLLFVWLADGVLGHRWDALNESLMRWQYARHSPGLERLARGLSWLGYGTGTTLVVGGVAVLLLARRHHLTAAALLAVVAGVLVLEWVLKGAFAVARPAVFEPLDQVGGYSFPSGHALRAAGVGAFLALAAGARAVRLGRPGWWLAAGLCLVVAAGVCWSRVYLGVHTPTDVTAGAVAASAWAVACFAARERAMVRAARRAAG